MRVRVARWHLSFVPPPPAPVPKMAWPLKIPSGFHRPEITQRWCCCAGSPWPPSPAPCSCLSRWGLRPCSGRTHLGARSSGELPSAPSPPPPRHPPLFAFVLRPDPRPSGRSCEPPAPCEGGGTFQCSAAAPSRFVIRQKAADCCNRYFSLKKLRSNLGEPFSMNTFTPERSLFSAST